MSMIGNYLKLSRGQLAQIVSERSKPEDFTDPEDGGYSPDALDIDKTWHLIHFLLTGNAWGGEAPLADAVLGGHELPDTDAGYGPFRYLEPEEVKLTAQALAGITSEALWSRFDAKKAEAAEIYPMPWGGDDGDREYIRQHFEALKQYFAKAAASDSAMLLYLN